MRRIFTIFSLLFIFGACTFVQPEYKGGEKFKFDGIDGRTVSFSVGATLYNPNGYPLKIKPSDLDLYIDGVKVGLVHLNEKVKLKAKTETEIMVPLTLELEDGMLFKLMTLVGKSELDLQIEGKVKAGVFLIFKNMDIDQSKTIDTSLFK